ncbi:MAG: hypothetical protein NZ730_06645 [Porticoccaceae bacterium]|nr:hypothetical protein [Porticoccaceae bacterium]
MNKSEVFAKFQKTITTLYICAYAANRDGDPVKFRNIFSEISAVRIFTVDILGASWSDRIYTADAAIENDHRERD